MNIYCWCQYCASTSSSSSSDPPPTWTQAHHPTQWQSWRIHNTQSIENFVLIIWCHIKGLVYLISFIYFFLKLIYSRCISLTNWSWFAIPTFQFRQVESCRKSRNFRQVSKKKKLSELKLSEFSLFFRRYAHIRVGDPAQSRNFQKNKTGIAAHKVWSYEEIFCARGAHGWRLRVKSLEDPGRTPSRKLSQNVDEGVFW